jgi:polysaccharide export outer membrane protein
MMAMRCRLAALLVLGVLASCDGPPPAPRELGPNAAKFAASYVIGPLDELHIFVTGAPDISVPVRPDGKITIPLVQDMRAAGKTATQLAGDIEQALQPYMQKPSVSVVVTKFADYSPYAVRVVGEAVEPTSVTYRPGLTVLDVMTAAHGLSEYAAGNSAKLIRGPGTNRTVYRLRLEDLLQGGDVTANVPVLPGDVIVIPASLL